ncbi:paraquat-inducible protein A [Roseomonas elaeocarpi]|uniref:Paraquat-inducible protein A n=1 Tax=Roseomonas elaeocarpi TaxID=907779 RepID=A0ABV6JRB3_9PROT
MAAELTAQDTAQGTIRAHGTEQHACPDCGQFQFLPRLRPGAEARCLRCDSVLKRFRQSPFDAPLALSIAGLLLYVMTLSTPFLSLNLLGRTRSSQVESGAYSFLADGFWGLTGIVLATLVLVPLVRLLLLLSVLLGLRFANPPPALRALFRWYRHLAPWGMVEVFLFGALVSYTRLVDLAEVTIGPGAFLLAGLALLTVATDAALDPPTIWEALDERCPSLAAKPAAAAPHGGAPRALGCHCCGLVSEAAEGEACRRCGAALHHRKRNSLQRSWALCLAAAVLYVPANYYPVMTIVTLGRGGPHTILGGVVEFIQSGFWPLALIVFLASVAVPMLKLVGLVVMMLGVQRRSPWRLRDRTRLYRLVEVIGRWSMIDVFVVSVLIALVRFGVLASINAEVGAMCFAGVVLLTMVAVETFDPRLMWDAANQPGDQLAAREPSPDLPAGAAP